MPNDLFRREVLQGQDGRLQGNVVLSTSPSLMVVCVFMVLACFCFGAWLTFGTYKRVEEARGIIVPENGYSKVFAMRSGVVSRVYVHDGSIVKKGDKLLDISTLLSNDSGISQSLGIIRSLDYQRDIEENKIRGILLKIKLESRSQSDRKAALIYQERELTGQLLLQNEVYKSNENTFSQLSSILEKGFVSKLEYERRRQSVLLASQEASRLRQQREALVGEISRLSKDHEIASLELMNQVNAAKSSIATIDQQKSRILNDAGYQIQAARAGAVSGMQVVDGQTIDSARPLMFIIPDNHALKLNLYVTSKGMGFVKVGQSVRVQLDSYPYQKYGSLSAIITNVAKTVMSASEADVPLKLEEPTYKITARLVGGDNSSKNNMQIKAGMSVNGQIILDKVTFIEWLFQPIFAAYHRS